MRLIVDTNQAEQIRLNLIPSGRQRPTLVIPPLVFEELLLGLNNDERRRALAEYDLLFGMDMATIFEQLAQKPEHGIRSFVPIHSPQDDVHALRRKVFRMPLLDHRLRAEESRRRQRAWRRNLLKSLPSLHKKHRARDDSAKSKGQVEEYVELHDPIEGAEHLFLKKDTPYRRWLISEVSTDADGKPRQLAAKSGDSMFDAVWENLILRRFLRLQAMVLLGYGQKVFDDKKLNRVVRENFDDMPDVSLTLYARDNDTILTADRMRERIERADAEKRIHVTTWDAWLAASPARPVIELGQSAVK